MKAIDNAVYVIQIYLLTFKKIIPKSVDSRINIMLLELVQKYGRREGEETIVELPMNREEMANYIGIARETLSRRLNSMKDEGIIRMVGNRKIIIADERLFGEYS